jgi:hypothetical protein
MALLFILSSVIFLSHYAYNYVYNSHTSPAHLNTNNWSRICLILLSYCIRCCGKPRDTSLPSLALRPCWRGVRWILQMFLSPLIYLFFFCSLKLFRYFYYLWGVRVPLLDLEQDIHFLVHLFDSRRKEDIFNVWIY